MGKYIECKCREWGKELTQSFIMETDGRPWRFCPWCGQYLKRIGLSGRYRSYTIKNVSPENLSRSLCGAAKQSDDGSVCVMVFLRPETVVPGDIDTLHSGDDGILIDVQTSGKILKEELSGNDVLFTRGSLIGDWPRTVDIGIPVRAISDVFVSYYEKKRPGDVGAS